jgi:beta-lactamase superfamily II metal-dependent hydrolase
MRAHFIDVGQGDATLLEFPCGAILVDTGTEVNEDFDGVAALQAYLEAFFANRTDLHGRLTGLILTHAHIDHVNGVDMVLERFKPANVVTNGLADYFSNEQRLFEITDAVYSALGPDATATRTEAFSNAAPPCSASPSAARTRL